MTTEEGMTEYVKRDAEDNGYYLIPDRDMLEDLIDGLVTNQKRYGYPSCPCRPASGVKTYDSDIICPCEYRDIDVEEYGMCYCGLFVSKEVKEDPSKLTSIPERRPSEIIDAAADADKSNDKTEKVEKGGSPPVWRCTVCGYLASRDTPPPICPICKAKAERFEKFEFG